MYCILPCMGVSNTSGICCIRLTIDSSGSSSPGINNELIRVSDFKAAIAVGNSLYVVKIDKVRKSASSILCRRRDCSSSRSNKNTHNSCEQHVCISGTFEEDTKWKHEDNYSHNNKNVLQSRETSHFFILGSTEAVMKRVRRKVSYSVKIPCKNSGI